MRNAHPSLRERHVYIVSDWFSLDVVLLYRPTETQNGASFKLPVRGCISIDLSFIFSPCGL